MTKAQKRQRERADKLVGDFVKARDGWQCQLRTLDDEPCDGPLAWCHLIPKGRYQSVRWAPMNAVSGCRHHHAALDSSPHTREAWAEQRLGSSAWEHLKLVARTTERPNPADVIAAFTERSTA